MSYGGWGRGVMWWNKVARLSNLNTWQSPKTQLNGSITCPFFYSHPIHVQILYFLKHREVLKWGLSWQNIRTKTILSALWLAAIGQVWTRDENEFNVFDLTCQFSGFVCCIRKRNNPFVFLRCVQIRHKNIYKCRFSVDNHLKELISQTYIEHEAVRTRHCQESALPIKER